MSNFYSLMLCKIIAFRKKLLRSTVKRYYKNILKYNRNIWEMIMLNILLWLEIFIQEPHIKQQQTIYSQVSGQMKRDLKIAEG